MTVAKIPATKKNDAEMAAYEKYAVLIEAHYF